MSTAWTARDNLFTLVSGLAIVQGPPPIITYNGSPFGEFPEEFITVTGEIESGEQEWAASALAAKEETYDLRIESFTSYATDDLSLVTNRLEAIGQAIEVGLKADYTLGGAVMLAHVARFRVEESIYENKRQGLLTQWVRCNGWLA